MESLRHCSTRQKRPSLPEPLLPARRGASEGTPANPWVEAEGKKRIAHPMLAIGQPRLLSFGLHPRVAAATLVPAPHVAKGSPDRSSLLLPSVFLRVLGVGALLRPTEADSPSPARDQGHRLPISEAPARLPLVISEDAQKPVSLVPHDPLTPVPASGGRGSRIRRCPAGAAGGREMPRSVCWCRAEPGPYHRGCEW